MIEYIRICVDDDVDAARRAFIKALMGYALARRGRTRRWDTAAISPGWTSTRR